MAAFLRWCRNGRKDLRALSQVSFWRLMISLPVGFLCCLIESAFHRCGSQMIDKKRCWKWLNVASNFWHKSFRHGQHTAEFIKTFIFFLFSGVLIKNPHPSKINLWNKIWNNNKISFNTSKMCRQNHWRNGECFWLCTQWIATLLFSDSLFLQSRLCIHKYLMWCHVLAYLDWPTTQTKGKTTPASYKEND